MEPTFTEIPSETVIVELAAQLATAVAALPSAHSLDPGENEPSESRDAAFVRLQAQALEVSSGSEIPGI
jgi:hypothetical protein